MATPESSQKKLKNVEKMLFNQHNLNKGLKNQHVFGSIKQTRRSNYNKMMSLAPATNVQQLIERHCLRKLHQQSDDKSLTRSSVDASKTSNLSSPMANLKSCFSISSVQSNVSCTAFLFIALLLFVNSLVEASTTSAQIAESVYLPPGKSLVTQNKGRLNITGIFVNITSTRKRATVGNYQQPRTGNQKVVGLPSSLPVGPSSVISEAVLSTYRHCPSSDDQISPCSCNATKREVSCRGIMDHSFNSPFNESGQRLRSAFVNFAESVPAPYQYFHSVYISIRGLTSLERDVFSGIRFNTIVVKSANLTYVDREAFNGLENYAQSMYFYGTNLSQGLPRYEFFNSIKSLTSLQKVIVNQHLLKEIPDNAFTIDIVNDSTTFASSKNVSELTEIQISNGQLESIGTDAFRDLRNLANLGLTKNALNKIKPYAFRMSQPSNMTLFIDLTENALSAESFNATSLLGAKRPVKINFGLSGCTPTLHYLPEKVFRPFLDEHPLNIIDVGRHCYHINCDCSMTWTLNANYTFRVKNFRCVIGISVIYYRDYIKSTNCYLKWLRKQANFNETSVNTNETLIEPIDTVNNNVTYIDAHPFPVTQDKKSTSPLLVKPYPLNLNETNETVLSSNSTSSLIETGKDPAEGEYCLTKECINVGLEMAKYMNKTVDPCESFYDYACNGWEKARLLEYLVRVFSNGGSEYDNFVEVRIKVEQNLEKLLINKAIITSASVNEKSASIFKSHYLKENSISFGQANESEDERNFVVPINPVINTMASFVDCVNNVQGPSKEALNWILDDIGGWPLLTKQFNASLYNWTEIYPRVLNRYKENIFIELDSAINENSTKHLMVKIGSFVVTRRKLLSVKLNRLEDYAVYILKTILHFGGKNNNNETLNEIWEMIKFEKQLAHLAKKNNGLDLMIERDLKTLGCLIEEVNWFNILKIAHGEHVRLHSNETINLGDTISMYNVHYLIDLSRLLAKTDRRVIANYIGWRVIESWGYLFGGNAFNEIQLHFYSTESKEGTKILKKQCLDPLIKSLHYLLARIYLERHLPPKSRGNARAIVEAVKQFFIEGMREKAWIDFKGLRQKVDDIHINIGYPDWILDNQALERTYEALNYTKLNDSSPLALVKFYSKVHQVHMVEMMTGLGVRVNKTEIWDPMPLYVGASYDIVDNIVSLPMGLLQPPFYEESRPFYLNYASLGSFFGHELSHSVTPRYVEFDRLLAPWTDQYLKDYLSKAQCFVGYYSGYYDKTAEQHLDGTRTFEEDMSDLSGVQAAYHAYQSYSKTGVTPRLQDLQEYNPDMLFFLSFAQKWCRSNTRVQTRYKISKSVHSPEKYRVNGALSNFGAFGKAYSCPLGTPMNPVKKCESW